VSAIAFDAHLPAPCYSVVQHNKLLMVWHLLLPQLLIEGHLNYVKDHHANHLTPEMPRLCHSIKLAGLLRLSFGIFRATDDDTCLMPLEKILFEMLWRLSPSQVDKRPFPSVLFKQAQEFPICAWERISHAACVCYCVIVAVVRQLQAGTRC
jgi:hypothetical protein